MDEIEKRREKVIQLIKQEKKQKEIAKILGVSQSVISYDVKILRKQGKILSKDEELEQREMQILQLNKQGKNQREIAQILDISQSKVSYDINILKSQGYNIVNPKRVIKIPKEVEERRKQILQLNRQGKRQVEIAKILGVSQSIISKDIKILKQQGNTIIKVETIKKTSKEIEERRKKVLQLNKQGKKQKEIAQILGVPISRVTYDIKILKSQGYNIIKYRQKETKLLEKTLKNNTYSKLNIDKLCGNFYGQPKILQKFNEYISYCKEEFKQGTLPKEELDRIKKVSLATGEYEHIIFYIKLSIKYGKLKEATKIINEQANNKDFSKEQRDRFIQMKNQVKMMTKKAIALNSLKKELGVNQAIKDSGLPETEVIKLNNLLINKNKSKKGIKEKEI